MASPPPPILQAIAKRDAARAEAARWDGFIKMWEELQGGVAQQDATQPASKSRNAPPQRVSVRGDETDALVAQIVAERGPMMTKALIPVLAERGMRIEGKDTYAVLHSRLARGQRLFLDKAVGWRLKEPRQEIGAAGPAVTGGPAASDPETPNDAARRGEVAHDNITA